VSNADDLGAGRFTAGERVNRPGALPCLGGGADDLSRVHYILLPSIPPLDTRAGGEVLLEYVSRVGADLVVFDTTARAVAVEKERG
jgi:hypothetical protein